MKMLMLSDVELLEHFQKPTGTKSNNNVNLDETVVELTTREMQVLQYICKEYRNTEIASELFLSVRTVEGHRNNLLIKTGCKSTAGLALFAVKHKLYKLDV